MEDSKERAEGEPAEPPEDERIERAMDILCDVCDEQGINISSWQDFASIQKYVNGAIDESPFTEATHRDLKEYSGTFGKYLVIEKENSADDKEETRKRAKRANSIFRELCDSAGLTLCFLNKFSLWSDFVEGKIAEDEFIAKAKEELNRLAAPHDRQN